MRISFSNSLSKSPLLILQSFAAKQRRLESVSETGNINIGMGSFYGLGGGHSYLRTSVDPAFPSPLPCYGPLTRYWLF